MPCERRASERVKKPIFVKINSFGPNEKYPIDISLDGFLIESGRFYDINHELEAELIIREASTIHVKTRVVWIYPKTKNAPCFQLALQFLDMSKEERNSLSSYIYRL